MKSLIAAFALSACNPEPEPEPADTDTETDTDTDADTDSDTDADTDTDTGTAPADFEWDLPGETPPTHLEAVWIARLLDEGDLPFSAGYWDAEGTVTGVAVAADPYVAAISVVAVDFADPCKSLALQQDLRRVADKRMNDGDTEGWALGMEDAGATTPEDFWKFSVGTAASTLDQLAIWELFDMGTIAPTWRMALGPDTSLGVGAAYHHREDPDFAAIAAGADPYAHVDQWVLSGPLEMTAFDPATGTLEATGTLGLRLCPPYDPTVIGFPPCTYPTDGATDGSVTFTLTATRCPELEDAIIGPFW